MVLASFDIKCCIRWRLTETRIMHELSIALNILDIAAEQSQRRDGAHVKVIHIRLGQLSGVVTGALVSAFELARECSPFTDCRLVVDEIPVSVYCPTCAGQRPVDSIQLLCCAHCGTLTANVISGRELEITAMEIEDPVGADLPATLENKV
jgi:hydrogenase nickel incorporation protein HypA/HybF